MQFVKHWSLHLCKFEYVYHTTVSCHLYLHFIQLFLRESGTLMVVIVWQFNCAIKLKL